MSSPGACWACAAKLGRLALGAFEGSAKLLVTLPDERIIRRRWFVTIQSLSPLAMPGGAQAVAGKPGGRLTPANLLNIARAFLFS